MCSTPLWKNLFCPLKVPVKGFRIGVPPLSSADNKKKHIKMRSEKNARNPVCGQAHILRCALTQTHTNAQKRTRRLTAGREQYENGW